MQLFLYSYRLALCPSLPFSGIISNIVSSFLGYDPHAPEPAMLMEPERPVYGTRASVTFRIPTKDIALLKELAGRMGWEVD